MFRDANEEFMMSFGVDEQRQPIEIIQHQNPMKNKRDYGKSKRYCQNQCFNMVEEKSEEKSFNSGINQVNVQTIPVPKKRNWLKQSMVSERKYSESNLGTSMRVSSKKIQLIKKESCKSNEESEGVESQTFMQENGLKQAQVPQLQELHPPEEDCEIYYMQKMRKLQTKFKQMNLLYQNQVLQLKKTNKDLQEKIQLYKQHILEYHPAIQQQIEKKLQEKEHQMSFMSSSSDQSKKSEEISMPVLSQIMEVKIQGKKLCDSIKDLLNKNKQLEKANATLKVQKNNALYNSSILETAQNPSDLPFNLKKITPYEKQSFSRKYSIPSIYSRQKRQSFQTAKTSQPSVSKADTTNQACHKCPQVKQYFLKINEAVKRIKSETDLMKQIIKKAKQ